MEDRLVCWAVVACERQRRRTVVCGHIYLFWQYPPDTKVREFSVVQAFVPYPAAPLYSISPAVLSRKCPQCATPDLVSIVLVLQLFFSFCMCQSLALTANQVLQVSFFSPLTFFPFDFFFSLTNITYPNCRTYAHGSLSRSKGPLVLWVLSFYDDHFLSLLADLRAFFSAGPCLLLPSWLLHLATPPPQRAFLY